MEPCLVENVKAWSNESKMLIVQAFFSAAQNQNKIADFGTKVFGNDDDQCQPVLAAITGSLNRK
jgi:hypothetical protein